MTVTVHDMLNVSNLTPIQMLTEKAADLVPEVGCLRIDDPVLSKGD